MYHRFLALSIGETVFGKKGSVHPRKQYSGSRKFGFFLSISMNCKSEMHILKIWTDPKFASSCRRLASFWFFGFRNYIIFGIGIQSIQEPVFHPEAENNTMKEVENAERQKQFWFCGRRRRVGRNLRGGNPLPMTTADTIALTRACLLARESADLGKTLFFYCIGN